MATGDIYGRVSLYNYPSTSHNAIRKIYLGHSSEVTNVQFVGKDTLLSAGGEDLSIFQWGIKHEPVEEKKRGKEKGKGTNQRSKRARRVNDIGLEDEVNQDAERPEKVRAQGEEEHDQKVKEATPYHYDEKEKKPEGH
jgi:WD40 repeat protein